MYKIRKELQPALRQASLKNRDELAVLLADLDQSMPQLIADHPDSADFMPLFAHSVDAIARQADAPDRQWLLDQVDSLLANSGLHGEEYLMPHDLISA